MVIIKTVFEEYELKETSPDRKAVIIFKNGCFKECKYDVDPYRCDKGIYSYQDWMFLMKIARQIQSIQAEKKGGD